MTARRVAVHRLGFERVQAPYGDPGADLALAADVADGLQLQPSRMRDYLRARTAFFDSVVVRALERGVEQVVVGAAGYDGRAYRYAKPGVRWFELDHPVTQRDKLARLRRLGVRFGHVRFVAADFTRGQVADLLLSAGFDVAAQCLFLLEGVAVYLENTVLESLLSQFRQVAAHGSHLAISVALTASDQAARERFQRSVAAMGEPALSVLEPGEAADLLARTGWHVLESTGPDGIGPDGTGPDGQEARARRERLRLAGLLMARAAP